MINTVMKFIGQYDTYRDMQKRAERKVGNVALCYTKKYGGYSPFVYDGRRWQVIQVNEEKRLLSDDGKCVVIDKLRVVGKGWVLIVDAKPKGLEVGRLIHRYHGFPFVVSGFGGWSHYKKIELILSPNDYVEKEIQVGDVLELITEDKQ